MRKVAPFIPALIWAAVIVILSLLPSSTIKDVPLFTIKGFDKIVHMGMYVVLAFLLMTGLTKIHPGERWKNLLIVLVTAGFFGVAMEVLQLVEGQGRHFELMDIIANISGTFLGGVAFIIFRKTK